MTTRSGSSICGLFAALLVFWFVSGLKDVVNAEEYTVTGIVTWVSYNTDGSPRTKDFEGSPPTTTCDFVWYRKAEKWRLDIREPPNSTFPAGVWKSIMQFGESNLISVVQYPPRPNDPKSKGNAYVTVMTNKFLAAENVYGAHAIWLTFNLGQIMNMFGPSRECPPFWDYDPTINSLPVQSHIIMPRNGSVAFYNPGHYFARDKNQNVIFEGGQPKFVPYPSPLDKGFAEAEYQTSGGFLDDERRIAKSSELRYWTALRDEASPNGLNLVMLSKIIVETRSVMLQPIPEEAFTPTWTNTFAAIVDFREKTANNQFLNYITKEKQINPNENELRKRKKLADKMLASAPTKPVRRLVPIVLLFVSIAILPVGIWWFTRKSQRRVL